VSTGNLAQNLEEGTLLSGRYRIDSVIGRGGMGAVYLAHLEALGNKPVAIKEMRIVAIDEATQNQAIKQFQQEANFLAHLDHPNLVQVSDYFCEDGRHYLVMAYVKGETLGELLSQRREPFTVLTVLEWALQLTSVLGYLHNQDPPIMFRDLKPSNIMLDESNKIRLIDFGIARSYNPESVTATFLQGAGSTGYSPMEQYQGGGTTDPRSDIYSLGATLYHLLTNQIPLSPVEVVSDGKSIIAPHTLNHNVTPGLEQILLKMLSLRKQDRQTDIVQVANQLRTIYVSLQQSSQATEALSGVIAALASQPKAPPAPKQPVARPVVAQTSVIQVTSVMPAKDPNEKYIWMVLASLCVVLMGVAGWMFSRLPTFQTSSATPTPATLAVGASPSVEKVPHSSETLAVTSHKKPAVKPQQTPERPKPRPAASAKPVATETKPQPTSHRPEVPALPDPAYPQAASVPSAAPKPVFRPTPTVAAIAVEPSPQPKPMQTPVTTTPSPSGPYNPYARIKDWDHKADGYPPPLAHGYGPPVQDGKGGWMPDPTWRPGQHEPMPGMGGPFNRSGGPNQGPQGSGSHR
jgi:serine/threonine protein kinase